MIYSSEITACMYPIIIVIYADDTAIYASLWNPESITSYIKNHLDSTTIPQKLEINSKPNKDIDNRSYYLLNKEKHILKSSKNRRLNYPLVFHC